MVLYEEDSWFAGISRTYLHDNLATEIAIIKLLCVPLVLWHRYNYIFLLDSDLFARWQAIVSSQQIKMTLYDKKSLYIIFYSENKFQKKIKNKI